MSAHKYVIKLIKNLQEYCKSSWILYYYYFNFLYYLVDIVRNIFITKCAIIIV